MKAQDLVGTWRLKTWQNVGSDGSVVDPLGEQPLGYIFYNHNGYVSVDCPTRTPSSTTSRFARTRRWAGGAGV